MLQSRLTLVPLLAAAFLFTACGPDDDSTPPTFEEAAASLASTVCDELNTCDPIFFEHYLTADGCEASFTATVEQWETIGVASVTPESIEACAQAMAGLSCDLFAEMPAACDFRGEAELGAACQHDFQCASGYCETEYDEADVEQCGVCAEAITVVDEGGDCSEGYCGADLYCGDGDVCMPDPGEGEACVWYGCRSGLSCVVTDFETGAGTCEPDLGAAEACGDATAACDRDQGLECISGTCAQVPRAAIGEACNEYPDDMADAIYCNASACVSDGAEGSVCVAYAQFGEACDEDTHPCSATMECLNGTCGVEPLPVCE